MPSSTTFHPLDPKLQISFYYRLRTVRGQYLLDALRKTVGAVETAALDHAVFVQELTSRIGLENL